MWVHVQYPEPLEVLKRKLMAAAEVVATTRHEHQYREAFFDLVQLMAAAAWWRGYEPVARAAGKIEKAVPMTSSMVYPITGLGSGRRAANREATYMGRMAASRKASRMKMILGVVEALIADPPSAAELVPAWPVVGHMAHELPYPFFVVHLLHTSPAYRPTGTGTAEDPLSARIDVVTRLTPMDVKDGYITMADAMQHNGSIQAPTVPAPIVVEEEFVPARTADGKSRQCQTDSLCAVFNPASTCGAQGVCVVPKTSAVAKDTLLGELRSRVPEAPAIEPVQPPPPLAERYVGPGMCTDGYVFVDGGCQPDPDDPRWADPMANIDDDDWMPPPPTATDLMQHERAQQALAGVDHRARFDAAQQQLATQVTEMTAARERASRYLGAERLAQPAAPAQLAQFAAPAATRQRRLGGRRVSGRN